MYLDTRTEPYTVLQTLPKEHTFVASSGLSDPIADGCTTGEFDLWEERYHIAEGFLPFTDTRPTYNTYTEYLVEGEIVIAEDGESASRTAVVAPLSAETIALQLSEAIETVCSSINTYRETIIESGFTYNGNTYDTKPPSLLNISGTAARCLLEPLPDGFTWRTQDNIDVPFTTDEFKAFAVAASDFVYAQHLKCRTHKDTIRALTTIENVLSYAYTGDDW